MKLFRKKSQKSAELKMCPFCGKDAKLWFSVECGTRLVCTVSCVKGCTNRTRYIAPAEKITMKDIHELMESTIEDWNKRG